jgi:DUF4097 and DUF4098 domain-containing protein YvlB
VNRTWRMTTRRVLLVAAVLAIPSGVRAQGYTLPERVDTTVALDPGGTVSVSIYSGRVNVVGTSGSSVRIRGAADKGELEIRARRGSVSVSAEPDGSSADNGGRAELDITVPVGTSVVLESFAGPVSIRSVKGEAQVESVSGDVQVMDAVGKVMIETVSGQIEVANVQGDVRAESVSGRVALSGITGDIDTESVSGRLSITGARSKSVRAESVSGRIAYGGTLDPAGNYVFKSHAGGVTLDVPADAGATVTLQTFSGNVDSDFPVTLESGKSRMGHESRFEFRIGNGRSRVILETFNGNIRIQRSTNRDNQE